MAHRLMPKLGGWHFGVLAALLGAGSDVWAQAVCSGVCVSYSTSVQGVPFTPAGLVLMAAALALVAAVVLRKQQRSMWALVLVTLSAVGGASFHAQEAQADVTYTVVINGASNPVNLALSGLPPVPTYTPVDVQNQLGTPVTITSITVASGLVLSPSSPLTSGSVIPPGTTVNGGILVACDSNDPQCTGF